MDDPHLDVEADKVSLENGEFQDLLDPTSVELICISGINQKVTREWYLQKHELERSEKAYIYVAKNIRPTFKDLVDGDYTLRELSFLVQTRTFRGTQIYLQDNKKIKSTEEEIRDRGFLPYEHLAQKPAISPLNFDQSEFRAGGKSDPIVPLLCLGIMNAGIETYSEYVKTVGEDVALPTNAFSEGLRSFMKTRFLDKLIKLDLVNLPDLFVNVSNWMVEMCLYANYGALSEVGEFRFATPITRFLDSGDYPDERFFPHFFKSLQDFAVILPVLLTDNLVLSKSSIDSFASLFRAQALRIVMGYELGEKDNNELISFIDLELQKFNDIIDLHFQYGTQSISNIDQAVLSNLKIDTYEDFLASLNLKPISVNSMTEIWFNAILERKTKPTPSQPEVEVDEIDEVDEQEES